MTIRVAINGFGRIGRAFARQSRGRGVEIVAVKRDKVFFGKRSSSSAVEGFAD